jgi:hypothetical protein
MSKGMEHITGYDIEAAEKRLKAKGKPYSNEDIAKEAGAKDFRKVAESLDQMQSNIKKILEAFSAKLQPTKNVVRKHTGWVKKELGLDIDDSDFFYSHLTDEEKRLPIETNEEIIRERFLRYAIEEDEMNKRIIKKVSSKSNTKPALSDIFKNPEGYNLCLKILDHYDAGKLTIKKAGVLFAIIIAFKENSHIYLKKQDYADDFLLSIFNTYLGANFIQIKKRTKTFKLTKEEIKKIWFTK